MQASTRANSVELLARDAPGVVGAGGGLDLKAVAITSKSRSLRMLALKSCE